MARTKVVVSQDGSQLQFIHSDAAVRTLSALGDVSMRRASHVEPWASLSDAARGAFIHDHGLDQSLDYTKPHPSDTLISATGWYVDLSPVGGRTAGPFDTKDEALRYEVKWIEDNALGSCPTQ